MFSWLLLALQAKVGKVASFVGKIFAVQYSTTKITNILPHENYQLYGMRKCHYSIQRLNQNILMYLRTKCVCNCAL